MIRKFFIFILIFITILSAQDKRKVALVPFENKGPASLNWISGGIEYLLSNKLSVASGFYVIDRRTMKRAFSEIGFNKGVTSDRIAIQIGRITGAEVAVSGTYTDSASQIKLSVYYYNTNNGNRIYQETIAVGKGELSNAADKIIQQLILISGVPVSDMEKNLMSRMLTRKPKAFESFIKAYMENNKPRPNTDIVIGLFRQAIMADKNFWEAYYNLGIVYFNAKKYDKALQQFNKIIAALPDFDKPYYGRGLIYEKQKKYDLAIKDFEQVIDFNPNDFKAYYNLGKISIKNKQYTQARKYLDKATELNPEYAPIYFEYGNLLVAQGNMRKSINDYRKAVELDPNNIKFRQTLGEVYYRSQIYYNALVEFDAILKMKPNHAVANFMRGVTIYKQAVLEELVEAFLDMLNEASGTKKAETSRQFKKNTAIDPVKKKKVYEDMVAAFTKAAQARPKFMQATFNLALTYLEMGDYNRAEQYFKKTIQIAPTLIKAYTKLAEVYEKTGRLPLAIEQYRKVFYLEPGIFVRQPTLGPEHHYRNVFKEFLSELNAKIKRNPNDVRSNIVLAKVFKAQGYNGKAANILRKVLSRQPNNREAKSILAAIEKGRR
ncbi:MAG: tetratricopeptide repeat protein [Calditrichaeota bacterium]|nr:MAG: tetratricopeptide repeat protein [Calditrichota bacterium]